MSGRKSVCLALVGCLVMFATGGSAYGDGCCFDYGFCLDLGKEQCAAQGGIYQGAGSDCLTLNCGGHSPDINRDGEVGVDDLLVVFDNWGACPPPCPAYCPGDVTTDCMVGTDDLLQVLANWGAIIRASGACCFEDGTCVVQDRTPCITLGGTYQGNNVACGGTVCQAACCLPDGSCQTATATDCQVLLNGTYQGFGSGCVVDGSCISCGIGACCLPDGSCQALNRSGCDASGGAYLGLGTTCVTPLCEVQVDTFDCSLSPCNLVFPFDQFRTVDVMGNTRVLRQVVLYLYDEIGADATIENGSVLPINNARMVTQGQVQLVLMTASVNLSYDEVLAAPPLAPSDGVSGEGADFYDFGHPTYCGVDVSEQVNPPDDLTPYIGPGQINATLDASGLVGVIGPTDLEFNFFNFKTDGVIKIAYLYALVPGACCDPCDGTCTPSPTETQCVASGGLWQGDNSVCTPGLCPAIGACCDPCDGTCTPDITEPACAGLGGVWLGACSACAPGLCSVVGACCLPSGSCIETTIDDCAAQNGDFQGACTLCATVSCGDEPGWNSVDNLITLTANEPTTWSAMTGQPKGVSPFTVLDPGFPPGRPAMDGSNDRVLRGYVIAWAVDAFGHEIRWNHLSGGATVVNYRDSTAWQYNAFTFGVVSGVATGDPPDAAPGVLSLDGVEYARPYDLLLLNFDAVGAPTYGGPRLILADSDLTLHPVSLDVRQETDGPVTTKANFDIWNMNEVKFSGLHRCITCWDQTRLQLYAAINHFWLSSLQTRRGKARIDGVASSLCNDPLADPPILSRNAALLGVSMKRLDFDGGADFAAAGTNLVGLGVQNALIQYDVTGGPPEHPEDGRGERLLTWVARELGIGPLRPDAALDTAIAQTPSRDDKPLARSVAPSDRVSATEKGSLIIISNVEIRWDVTGALVQDTYISLTNDYPEQVRVLMYFINGDTPQ